MRRRTRDDVYMGGLDHRFRRPSAENRNELAVNDLRQNGKCLGVNRECKILGSRFCVSLIKNWARQARFRSQKETNPVRHNRPQSDRYEQSCAASSDCLSHVVNKSGFAAGLVMFRGAHSGVQRMRYSVHQLHLRPYRNASAFPSPFGSDCLCQRQGAGKICRI